MFLASCSLTKRVPEGQYLVKKNKVKISGDKISEDEVLEIIRQPENFKTLGMKLKLRAYNMIDSAAVAEKRIEKNEKIDRKNAKKRAREKRVNQRRIDRAERKGDSLYTHKNIPLKDTLTPKRFFREWLKYKYGEPPMLFDSTLYLKTIEQHANFLKKKGYYFGTNSGKVRFKKKKAIVTYTLVTGPRYYIDSVYVITEQPNLRDAYYSYIQKNRLKPLEGEPFDRDLLNDYRSQTAKCFKDDAFFGFSPSNINYLVDTNALTLKVRIGLQITPRAIYDESNRDTIRYVQHKATYIRRVYFHISDTNLFVGNFRDSLTNMGLSPYEGQFLQTIDTLRFETIVDKKNDQLDSNRMATFTYNGEIFVEPAVMESQNYLEEKNVYKEYYIERTYSRLLQLGLFQTIKPVLVENEGTNTIDVHYYLIPSSKQSFGFEPRLTNSNGFLGASASVNYKNNNLLGGAQKMIVALALGFQSQPPVFDPNQKDGIIEQSSSSFNTLEFGPSVVFDIPGLFPSKLTALSKRHRPRTIVSAAYNFQKRSEYTRNTFQANYLWKMYVSKTQVFQFGLPLLSVLKYVNITKSASFEAQINQFNDLFLRNSYSDQLIWQDFKFSLEYNNKDRDNKTTQFQAYYSGSFDPAGNFISLFQSTQDTSALGKYQIFGVPYSRFVRFDNDFILAHPVTKKSSIHTRLLAGVGVPTGNKETSLPFDYSFFAGGSNDNRGWRARSLGPGGYKYLLDTNRTLTQIGDIRLGGSIEYRFSLGKTLKMGLFVDAGNIWTMREDKNRPGSQFSKDWYNQIAYSSGFGFRFDLDFFIVRFDFGFPMNNHTLPKGAQWVWQSRDLYNQQLIDNYGAENVDRLKAQNKIPNPFGLVFHFGIGYPF